MQIHFETQCQNEVFIYLLLLIILIFLWLKASARGDGQSARPLVNSEVLCEIGKAFCSRTLLEKDVLSSAVLDIGKCVQTSPPRLTDQTNVEKVVLGKPITQEAVG